MLEKELKIYESNKAKLKQENISGYVVIKDEEILGVWNDRQDALKAGIEKYGNVPFLVKNINESGNHVNTFSRNLIFVN
jgi:hypothetical protein